MKNITLHEIMRIHINFMSCKLNNILFDVIVADHSKKGLGSYLDLLTLICQINGTKQPWRYNKSIMILKKKTINSHWTWGYYSLIRDYIMLWKKYVINFSCWDLSFDILITSLFFLEKLVHISYKYHITFMHYSTEKEPFYNTTKKKIYGH